MIAGAIDVKIVGLIGSITIAVSAFTSVTEATVEEVFA